MPTEMPTKEIVDNNIIAEVVMNDLIQGMKRREAERLLADHIQVLSLVDKQADTHAAKLLNFYTSGGGNSLFERCGLEVSPGLDGFKQALLDKARGFNKLASTSQEAYLDAIKAGKKLTSASFPPAP